MIKRYGLSSVLVFLCLVLCASALWGGWVKDGVSLCAADGWQVNMKAVTDDSGGAVVVWMDRRAISEWDIYGNRIDARGRVLGPESGVSVCSAAGDQTSADLIPDGTGGGIVVWQDGRGGTKVYAQRIDGSGVARWTVNGIALCGGTGSQIYPRIVSDGNGGALVAWSDDRDGNYNIYVQRVDADGNLLFGANGAAMCVGAGEKYLQDMTEDGAGGAIIAWIDSRSTSIDVYAQRFDADGVPLWAINGVAVCDAEGGQSSPRIAPIAGGGAVVVYQGPNPHSHVEDVYAQKLDAGGGLLWGDGYTLSSATGEKTGPRAVADGAGGAIVAWYAYENGDYAVIAQRIDSAGNTGLWDYYGVKVFPGPGEGDITMIEDGAGGAILALDAYYDDYYFANIYAQRVDANGNLRWMTPRGTGVCTAVDSKYSPALLSDGSGGAIVTWEDLRNGDRDAYIQRVTTDGLWGIPEPEIASCADLPDDQGGWVRIGVRASSLDIALEQDYPIAGYNVWRAITRLDSTGIAADPAGGADPAADRAKLLELFADPSSLAGMRLSREQAGALGFPEGDWESVAFQFATQDTLYDIDAPTRNDSTGAGNAREVFVVTAHTTTPSVFVFSEPDTAWSVDNLAPGLTSGFAGNETASPPGLGLSWTPNAASDLWKYDVHRGDDELFAPDASNVLGTTTGTEIHDDGWVKANRFFYKLVAVDRHGNRSSAALLAPGDIKVATLLQSFSATLAGSGLELSWILSAAGADMSFVVLRSSASGDFEELALPRIVRDELSFFLRDGSCEPGTAYRYRVDVVDESGRRTLFETDEISTPAMPLALHQNHPNPFNPSTTIDLYLPAAGQVTLDVYDSTGRLVARLLDRAMKEKGTHSIEWRGLDAQGRSVSSGVYFYRLTSGKKTISKKMVLLR
jgi:hypothetical protein